MTTTYPCPYCRTTASADTGCPGCGRAPDADALEVMRADAEIAELLPRLATARGAVSELETRIGHAYQRRNQAAERVRARQRPDRPKSEPETSSRAIQNVLFLLGGLLLAVAATVFTAVAWSQFGVTGRAAILVMITAAALAVPPLVRRRGLTAAAETVAAVAMLLIPLDGYAAWYVHLFDGNAVRYAGVVFAVTAAAAAGYARLTGLTAPRYAALLAAQPALPLLVAPSHPGPAGWTLTFGVLAALNVRARPAVLARVLAAVATAAALTPALVAAVRTAHTARPFFHAAWSAPVPPSSWRLPAALAVATAALCATLPSRLRPAAVITGAAATILAVPSGLHLPWWHAPVADLLTAAAALALAIRHAPGVLATPALATPAARVAAHPAAASASTASSIASLISKQAGLIPGTTGGFIGQLIATAVLAAHAVVTGFGRPATATAVLTTIALLGLAAAARARHRALNAAGLFTAYLAVPAVAWTATAALDLSPTTQLRAVAVAITALVATLHFRHTPRPALIAALLATAPLPLWAATTDEPIAVYGILTVLLIASALSTTRPTTTQTPSRPGAQPLPPQPAPDQPPTPQSPAPRGPLRQQIAEPHNQPAPHRPPTPQPPAQQPLPQPASPHQPPAQPPQHPLVPAQPAEPHRRRVSRPFGREPELTIAVAAVVALGLAVAGGPLPDRARTLAALAALLVASAVTATAGRARAVRVLGTVVSVLAGWGIAGAAPDGAVLEAYTLPAAGLALAAALLARRGPAASWVSFGPALSTALTPSLVLIFSGDGQHLRRLLVGIGALAVLLVGARARLRAPVLAGAVALALLALHELVLVWDLVPRWIPLAAGGLLLVVLATTLERRRRDLSRLRGAWRRMA